MFTFFLIVGIIAALMIVIAFGAVAVAAIVGFAQGINETFGAGAMVLFIAGVLLGTYAGLTVLL